MLAEDFPGLTVDQLSGPGAQPAGQKSAGIARGNETDVVAVRFAGNGQAASRRLGPDLALGGVPDRKQRVRQLLGGEPGEHIRLVLTRVHRPA
jgi:hypothetical protein